MDFFLYIVRCKDNSLYTGITKDVEKRIVEHNTNNRLGAKAIRGKRPVTLVYTEKFSTLGEALRRESEIKSWSKDKKENLITRW